MNIRTYGTDERLGFCREYLYKEKLRSVGEIILLPIPTSRGGVPSAELLELCDELYARYSEGELSGVGETAVVGYGIPKEIRDRLSEVGALALDVSLDEEFVLENARLTAVGALGRLLTEEKSAPSELSIGIIGYGRIGKRLLNYLTLLGARPTVFTANASARLELGRMGVPTAPYSALERASELLEIGNFDVIINTAPDMLIKEGAVTALASTKIMELASGNNFPLGLYVTALPSLPARAYPKSAGKALCDSVLRMLGERTLK